MNSGLRGVGPDSYPNSVRLESTYGNIALWPDAPTITLDCYVASRHQAVLGGNRILAVTRDQNGQVFELILQQDATGSRTITWFSGILWANGILPALTTTANKRDVFIFQRISLGVYLGWIVGQNH